MELYFVNLKVKKCLGEKPLIEKETVKENELEMSETYNL